MFEAMASFLMVEHLAGQTFVPPTGETGYSRILSKHRRPFKTADGYIGVMPYTAAHWDAVFRAANREDWAAEAASTTNAGRAAMIDTLYERLATCLLDKTSAEWLAALDTLQVPCAPINALDDLLKDPHLQAVGLFEKVDHPTEGEIINVRSPIRFSGTPVSTRKLAPK